MSHLLKAIAESRDVEAFRSLVSTYDARLRRTLLKRGSKPSDVDELVQETLFSVWRKSGLYNSEKGTVASWIFAIARNHSIDFHRKARGMQELSNEMVESIPSNDSPADDQACFAQRQKRVASVLDGLPASQKEVLVLAYYEGFSHAEIARSLSLPLGTVKSRIRLAQHRARVALQDLQ